MASLVDKATSDMLIGPDWAMNMEICDIVNRDPGLAKDVVKAIKKRLGHRNPKVQLLALTVLETIVKNCGPPVHHQVAEKDVLHEMVKIVKRKTDMHVRDKILVLISSWHEAFGGPRGRYPQYFMAFEELRRLGVEFPDRPAERDAPIFTPPQSHPLQPQPGYGSPANMPSRLEALMNNDLPGLSLTEIDTARGRVEVLMEMLNAVNPRDRLAVKDELIVELVEQCRSTQQRVMSLVNNTSDEELLRQGLGLNDDLQKVLEKHDAIASGKAPAKDPVPQTTSKPLPAPSKPTPAPSKPLTGIEDDFAQLAMRSPKKAESQPTEDPFVQLALPAPPTPKKTVSSGTVQKPQDLIDLLSGESLEDRPPAAPSTPPIPSAPVMPTSSPDVSSGNPFGPAFQAVPSTQSPYVQQDPSSQFGSSLQTSSSLSGQPQQQQQFGANGSTFGSQQFGSASSPFSNSVGTSFGSQPQQQYAQPQQQYQQPQQQYPNGTSSTGANGYQQQQQQQNADSTQQGGFSFPQYQGYTPSQNTGYAAPWAAPSDQLSPQQQAMIYGSVQGSQLPSQPTAAPWAGQQQTYGNYYGYGYGYGYPYADQYTYQYGANSYYQNGGVSGGWNTPSENQLALVPVSSSTASASGSSASKPKDKLFEDLVDMQSLKFKSAGVSRGSL